MNKNIVKRVTQVIFSLFLQSAIMFLSAWTIKWDWAWILTSVNVFILLINFCALPREVIEERGRKKENVKKWDKILSSINIVPWIGIYVVSGLEYRFYWSDGYGSCIQAAGLAAYFLGSMLVTWAMVSNRYFSTMVRLQTDRGHQVAAGGPYRYVRHPGYVGFIVTLMAVPVGLGSLYGLIMSAISAALFILRTYLEDKTLQAELDGYSEYSKRVKYRLLPYIW